MTTISGSCACGKVTYSSSADPVFIGLCHCTSCQKSTGTAFGTVLAVPTASLTITGTTKQYDRVGDSGKAVHRAFCPECGAALTQWADIMEGLTMIMVGTLADPATAKPAMQIYCDSALPWSQVAGLQAFPKMPGPG